MNKIIITGCGGLVGMNLLNLIDKKKYKIIGIDFLQKNIKLAQKLYPEVKFYCADVKKKGTWEKEFKDADCIIQLQAQISSTKVKPYVDNNIKSVKKILKLCEKNKIKNLIHISSSVVISVANDHYTNTKKIGEELVKKSKIPYTILRPPLMYGCFDVKHLGFLTKILEISPIFPMPGNGKYMRQPLFVEDLCNIIIKNIKIKPKNKIYNIIGKERINFIDLLKIIAKKRKMHRFFLKIPIPIFLILIKTWGIITGHKPFVPDQLKALTAGDDFPLENWEKTFKIKYTSFNKGITKTINSKNYKYRKVMERNKL